MLAPIYVCPKHGEIWDAETAEDIDTTNDDIYQYKVCPRCWSEVRPLLQDGNQVFHVLTEDEMFWEMRAG